MPEVVPLPSEAIRTALTRYASPTASNFREFEFALQRAMDIYSKLPAEVVLRSSRYNHPSDYGDDLRTSMFGMLEEHLSYLEAIRVTCGHKLFELAQVISEGFCSHRFRMAVLATRTLFEEAASAKYYLNEVVAAVKVTLLTPPSSFRLQRLTELIKHRDEFGAFLQTVSLPGQWLKKWYHVRKIDWTKPNFYEDHKLDARDPLFPGFFLSSFKQLKWREQIPAPYFYAVLCEATHPNSLSNTLYVDDTMGGTDDRKNVFIIRKVPLTTEPYITLYDYISTPTVECIGLLDSHITDLTSMSVALTDYLAKARRVSQ